MAPIITSLINNFITLSTFPLPWKKAEIVQVLKSGDSEEPANTRPISLLPILSKSMRKSGSLAVSLPISLIQTMSYIPCKVEIENFTQPSLHYFTPPMNCLITCIRRRYLLLFFWTCPKLLIAFDTI